MTYGPAIWRPVALLAGALAAAGGALAVAELWVLAAVLLVVAIRDWRSRPALNVGLDGFTYVAGLRREYASWTLVDDIRVRHERHFLAWGNTVEIDLSDDRLIVLSKAQLAAEPEEVAGALETARRNAVRSAPPS